MDSRYKPAMQKVKEEKLWTRPDENESLVSRHTPPPTSVRAFTRGSQNCEISQIWLWECSEFVRDCSFRNLSFSERELSGPFWWWSIDSHGTPLLNRCCYLFAFSSSESICFMMHNNSSIEKVPLFFQRRRLLSQTGLNFTFFFQTMNPWKCNNLPFRKTNSRNCSAPSPSTGCICEFRWWCFLLTTLTMEPLYANMKRIRISRQLWLLGFEVLFWRFRRAE
jgi:hypothetical protein